METADLVIEASSSSLHLIVSEEEAVVPQLSSLSHSSSTLSEESSDKEESSSPTVTDIQPLRERLNSTVKRCSNDYNSMGSGTCMKSVELNKKSSQAKMDSSEIFNGERKNNPSPDASKIKILSAEEVDGSTYIEVKDDGCGNADETVSEKVQRLARKAGIIAGGGTLTAVGTVMLFLPCPTPSIYLMIGGMAIMSKEIPAAQRQLDSTKESLERALDRAEKKFATGRKINIVFDNGSSSKERESEEKRDDEEKLEGQAPQQKVNHTAMTQELMIQQQNSAVKRHFVKVGRNVILPLLNKVCTPQDGVEVTLADDPVKTEPSLESTNDDANVEGKENASPLGNPFTRFAKFRETRRVSLLIVEEQREREAMLARINEANLREARVQKSPEEAEAQKLAQKELDEILKI